MRAASEVTGLCRRTSTEKDRLKKLWLLLIPVFAIFVWAFMRRSAPPEVPFTKVTRESIVSTLTTNGKVEPETYSAIRAEAAGAVKQITAQRGQEVTAGQMLVQLGASSASAALAGAQARAAQSRAELSTLEAGGSTRDLVQIDSSLTSVRSQLASAQKESETLQRLATKQAATRAEAEAAKNTVAKLEQEMQSLEQRRQALVSAADRTVAQARLQEAESGVATARVNASQLQVRSPIGGTLYAFDVKPGAYLNPGDQIGQVGNLSRMRVTVYVDEPELGRVAEGMPVTISWDALPGKQWTGTVEHKPTQIVTLGTRQVGEVTCLIENPDRTLIPGVNVNAEIRSSSVQNVVSIPKEALRRQGNESGVYKLADNEIVWQPVRLGVSSVTRIQALSGLKEGDSIVMPTEQNLRNRMQVRPFYP